MAIYIDTLPYLMTKTRRYSLPKTSPSVNKSGFGNLIFLMSDNVDNSIKMMINNVNMVSENKYRDYYYTRSYKGTLFNNTYSVNDNKERKLAYTKARNAGFLCSTSSDIKSLYGKNVYFEMCKYMQLYGKLVAKTSPTIIRQMVAFWKYLKSIVFSDRTSMYTSKYILINADNYDKFGTNVKDNLKNPIFMLYYTMYLKPELLTDINIDILIYSDKASLKVNPSRITKRDYIIFKRELKKVMVHVQGRIDACMDDTKISNEIQADEISSDIKTKYSFTGVQAPVTPTVKAIIQNGNTTINSSKKVTNDTTVAGNKTVAEINKKIDDKVEKSVAKVNARVQQSVAIKTDMASPEVKSAVDEISKKQVIEDIENDKELVKDMYNVVKKQKLPTKPLSTKRDEELRKKQYDIKVNNITLKDIDKINTSKVIIPTRDISSATKITNKNMKTVKYTNIQKTYNEEVMPKDILNAIMCLNDKSTKFYIRDIKVEETSDELNYKDTYTVSLEDEYRQRHVIKVDLPKIYDNKFLYLGGNKKILMKQNFLYPVVKTAHDTVQIVTNYNKMFIRRQGAKSIGSVERIIKLVSTNESVARMFVVGNVSAPNKQYITTLEYDEFSKNFVKFENNGTIIYFNQEEISEIIENKSIDVPDSSICIGFRDDQPIFINTETQLSESGRGITEEIVHSMSDDIEKEFNKTRVTKKLLYNTVTIMAQTIPLVMLLCYWEGLTSVLRKLGVEYTLYETYPKHVGANEAVLRFKDGFLCYKETMGISLLLNGLRVIDTSEYTFEEFEDKDTYIPYFRKVYGKISIINTLSNAYDFTIDPITYEVLTDIDLPTDLVELCIYANNLLVDDSYTLENSQTLSRVRSYEVIPAILYNEIAKNFVMYKNSGGKKKLSIARDSVIKQLLALTTCEDYSTLNPVVELEKDRAITAKGFRGVNVDGAYTEEKRSYDDTMIGVIGMSTSPDANCGINRQLTMEPAIACARGYVDIKKDKIDTLKDVNVFTPAELVYPLGNSRDDSIRTSMSVKQTKHVIPVHNSTPTLITNGADEAIKYHLSSDFVVTADEDGSVIDYDDKSQIMMVKYKSGKVRAIDMSNNIVKNGGGGFYLANQLTTTLKVGQKFKQNDTLAWHKDFFKNTKFSGNRMNAGVLTKVAIMSSYASYNDSTAITHKLAKDAATDMVYNKAVVIGKNSNVDYIVKVGDEVNIGDTLVQFDTSYDESELNKLLANMSQDDKDTMNEHSRNNIKAKHAGKIVDIKIYSTVDLEELSPSLQNIVKSYYGKISHKNKFVSKYDSSNSLVKCGIMLNETTGKVEPNIYGVIKGNKVSDAVLIEFYISHEDVMGVGDKLAYFTALKSIVGEVIPVGYEPRSAFRPYEEISSIIGPSAIIKRQTPSIMLTVGANKVLVELKRAMADIYNRT